MMNNLQMAQLGAALLAVATPWIVVLVARAVATRQVLEAGQTMPPLRRMAPLGLATAVAAVVVGVIALSLQAPSAWMGVIDIVAFAALSTMGLRVLGELDSVTTAARNVDSPTRTASLMVRRLNQYLPTSWRFLLFGVTIAGLALFVWRLTIPVAGDRRLFVPITFALIAPVFLWLYETWIHTLVTGPALSDAGDSDDSRRRWIRIVFRMEFVLVTTFLAVAHVTLTAGSWAAIVGIAGGVLGVVGCGLALSSDLITRRYATARDPKQMGAHTDDGRL